jgi:hypothetical protein
MNSQGNAAATIAVTTAKSSPPNAAATETLLVEIDVCLRKSGITPMIQSTTRLSPVGRPARIARCARLPLNRHDPRPAGCLRSAAVSRRKTASQATTSGYLTHARHAGKVEVDLQVADWTPSRGGEIRQRRARPRGSRTIAGWGAGFCIGHLAQRPRHARDRPPMFAIVLQVLAHQI